MRPFRALVAVGAAVVGVSTLALSSCANDRPGTGAPGGAGPLPGAEAERPPDVRAVDGVRLRSTRLARVVGIPTAITGAHDGSELLVAQVTGEVRRIRLTERDGYAVPHLDPKPVVDLSDRTQFDGQNRGLLGLVVSADGSRIIACYTATLDGAVTVESFPYTPGEDVDGRDGVVELAVEHPLSGLSGGNIAIDADGNLFVSVGDMDLKYTVPPAAQDPRSLLGAVSRIDAADLGSPGADPTVVAKGLRNPWGLSADPVTGDVWVGDVGDQSVEEFNRVPAADLGRRVPNFGWPYFEGRLDRIPPPAGSPPFDEALRRRRHRYNVCGAVGGLVSRSASLPDVAGAYLYGDLCSTTVRALVQRDGRVVDDALVATIGEQVLAFGTGHDGTVYVLGGKGGVYRLDPREWAGPSASTPEPTMLEVEGHDGPPPSDAPGTTTPGSPTTTAGSGRPPIEVCALIDTFIALDPLPTLAPDVAQREVEEALRRARAAETAAAPADAGAFRTFRERLEQLEARLRAADWDTGDPAVRSLIEDAQNGRPPYEDFPDSINTIIQAQVGCPGIRL